MEDFEDTDLIEVFLDYEDDFNPETDGYGLTLMGLPSSGLNLSAIGGVDDISLINEAVYEWFDPKKASKEMTVLRILLKQDGEWEDVFWHRYFTVISCVKLDTDMFNKTWEEISRPGRKEKKVATA